MVAVHPTVAQVLLCNVVDRLARGCGMCEGEPGYLMISCADVDGADENGVKHQGTLAPFNQKASVLGW